MDRGSIAKELTLPPTGNLSQKFVLADQEQAILLRELFELQELAMADLRAVSITLSNSERAILSGARWPMLTCTEAGYRLAYPLHPG